MIAEPGKKKKEIMKNKLNTALGFYTPSFMRMHVGTDLGLTDYRTLNDDNAESIFLHEFSHFIQDITTVYGLCNINVVVDYMKFVNNEVIKSTPGPFNVPVLPQQYNIDNVYANLEINTIYNGDGDDDDVTFVNHNISSRSVLLSNKTVNPSIIEISYLDTNGAKKKFEFGTLCIMENMSYIIECKCYANCEESPDIPYLAAEKLVELIYPSFGSDRLNILALCDASLQVFHPAESFYKTLLKIKADKVVFNKPEEIYAYFCSNLPRFNFNGANDLRSLLVQQSKLAISQMKGYFNDDSFSPIKDWLENMIKKGVEFRLSNPTFPLDIARGGKLKNNIIFRNFFKNVGTPLMTNDLDDVFIYDPNNSSGNLNYPIIWAIDQIHQIFWGYQTNCELKEVCEAGGITTDTRCDNSPWDRVNDNVLCPFATIWRHWKLAGYSPL